MPKFKIQVFDVVHRAGEVEIEADDKFEAEQITNNLYESDKIEMENCHFKDPDYIFVGGTHEDF